MALTLNEDFRWTAGGKAFRWYTVTYDEATSTIYATSLDLEYIEGLLPGQPNYASDIASMGAGLCLSIAADHKSIDVLFAEASTGTIASFIAVGW